jgi:uncharacterized protein (TIGR02145 family)
MNRFKLSHFGKNTENSSYNGHEYVEIGGIKWATCNVGADKPIDSGLYFAWGETQGFTAEQVENGEKQFNWNNYKYGTCDHLTKYNNADNKIVLEPIDDAATFNMGIGWRMPTREEFKTLVDSTTRKWVTNYKGSGVNGMLFTDKKDNAKTLFFPAVGRCGNDSVYDVGSYGYYWPSSLSTSNVIYGRNLLFGSDDCHLRTSCRCVGFAVRGVVD